MSDVQPACECVLDDFTDTHYSGHYYLHGLIDHLCSSSRERFDSSTFQEVELQTILSSLKSVLIAETFRKGGASEDLVLSHCCRLYVCMYVCMHVFTYVYVSVCRRYMYGRAYIHAYLHACIRMYTYLLHNINIGHCTYMCACCKR